MSRLKSNKMPHGKAILNPNWPDAKWDLGGLFVHDDNIINIIDVIQKKYDCILPIKSVFGCYSVVWSGGRSTYGKPPYDHSGWTPEVVFKKYNRKGIDVTYTFSNTLLKEEHLSDPSSNYLLDQLGKQEYEGNAVTIACDILSDYIREKYPNLKQKASIVKITKEMPKRRTFEYYDNLFEKYDLVYLHPDDNLNFSLLKKIVASGKAGKYILLINEPCAINCSIRDSHYDEYSRAVIDGWHGMFNFNEVDDIHSPSHPNSICERWTKSEMRTCALSKGELKEVYDLGFRNFKLQGRDYLWVAVLKILADWMVEQDDMAAQLFSGEGINY